MELRVFIYEISCRTRYLKEQLKNCSPEKKDFYLSELEMIQEIEAERINELSDL